MNILVSACLLGLNCKYNGGNNYSSKLAACLPEHRFIPVCPEQLGGLCTPREPSEIQNGTGREVWQGKAEIWSRPGGDVTEAFKKGAAEALKLAKLYDCRVAILKARSPSCGYGLIYDGSFSGRLIEGNGACAELLSDEGILILNEDNFEAVLNQ